MVGVNKMENSKEYLSFSRVLQEVLQKKLGSSIEMEICPVLKNNAHQLDGLILKEKGCNISPNFYLQHYYKRYKNGELLDDLTDEIVCLWEQSCEKMKNVSIDFSFHACKERIILRLISMDQNEELLETIPYIPILDLAITFHCLMDRCENGIGTLRITNALLEDWGCSVNQLMDLAMENTMELFPARMCPLSHVINQLMASLPNPLRAQTPEFILHKDAVPGEPWVVTNSNGINGATVMVYDGLLKEIATYFEGNFYILPSSIHEILVIAKTKYFKEEELKEMVQDVNAHCVCPEEVLSDEIYEYHFGSNHVSIVSFS